MEQAVTIIPADLQAILSSIRIIVKEEILAESKSQMAEQLLSPDETRKLFNPAISRPTLNAWTVKGDLTVYKIGGRNFYKYSEVMNALKQLKRYSRPHTKFPKPLNTVKDVF